MRSDAYWTDRFDQLTDALIGKGEKYTEDLNTQYDKAMASLQRDIDTFYTRFGHNNGIMDMATARQVLKAGELKEFKWTVEEYIEKGKENAVDLRWMKELENASIKVRVSRLEALQTQMRQHIEILSAKQQKGTADTMGTIYKDGYYQSIYEMQKGVGLGSSFAKLDHTQIEKLLSRPWSPDGTNFSTRIWGDKTKLLNELQTALTHGLIRGDTAKDVVDAFAKKMKVSRSNAERLILTESAYFSGQSRLDAYKELGVEMYKYTATLDSRTSPACRDMDGKEFLLSEAQAGVNYPPLHVRCRSTTIPHYEENVKVRSAMDDKGEYYDVPGGITYPDWEATYAKEASEPFKLNNIPDPAAPQPPTPAQQPFVPAKTVQEAEEAALRDYGFDKADYTGLDVDSANSVNRAMDKAMKEYPSIKGFAKEITAVDTEDFVAQAGLEYTGGKVLSNLKISSHYYNSQDIDDIIKASVDVKHWPPGSNRESLFVHEFGHLLEYAHAMKVMGVWTGSKVSVDDVQIIFSRLNRGVLSTEIVKEALANLGIDHTNENIREELSDYANKNSKEILAESFAEAIGIENPRRLATEVIRILNRKLQEAGML
ncbi:minor capsid protein [Paenibacillus gansuensis]|uniref:Minor capsid protein n=1 Tax=Paenibacillus gansuensis TaxID=306542 RepID=A0ABW5PGT0_9BACL